MIAAARASLERAHAALAEETAAHEAAAHAAGASRAFASNVQADVDRFNSIDDCIGAARASALKAAILAGISPTFSEVPALTHNSAERADALNRLAAATQTVNELKAEERQAAAKAAEAKYRLRVAVFGVLVAEADAIAGETEALEAQSHDLRKLIGARFGFIDGLGVPTTQRTKAVIRSNGETDLMLPNTPAWLAAKTAELGVEGVGRQPGDGRQRSRRRSNSSSQKGRQVAPQKAGAIG